MGEVASYWRRGPMVGLAMLALSLAGQDVMGMGLYRLTDLGVGTVVGVNDLGQVLMNTPSGSFIQTGNTRVQVSTRYAAGFNNRGQVVLWHSDPSDPRVKGVIWENGAETPLHFSPRGINDNGDVVGLREVETVINGYERVVYRTILYKQGTEYDVMGNFWPGAVMAASPNGLNNLGQVVGDLTFNFGFDIPPTGFVASLGGGVFTPRIQAQNYYLVPDQWYIYVAGINDSSTYTGTAYDSRTGRSFNFIGRGSDVFDEYSDAIIYGPYGFPPPDGSTEAVDINNRGQILAYREAFDIDDPWYSPIRSGAWAGGYGFWTNLYDQLTDDTRPIWNLENPVDLSNSGHVVGYTRVDGENRMWLLTPMGSNPPPIPSVPEPGTWILALTAVPVGIGWLRRYRRRPA